MNDLLKYFKESLREFFQSVGITWLENNINWIIDSGLLIVLGTLLVKLFPIVIKFVSNRLLAKDLHPFFSLSDVKDYTQFYIPTKGQNIPPSNSHEPSEASSFAAKEVLIPFFLKRAFKFKGSSDKHRFYFVLADSGMGKTAFMINLYLKYKLRVNFFRRKFNIVLLPFGSQRVIEEISKIKDEEKKNTILLLDAFDEDNEALKDHQGRLKEILNELYYFREVVVTCRTQFFASNQEEPKETGILRFGTQKGQHIFKIIYLSPFDDSDIRRYLRKKYSFTKRRKRKQAFQIVKKAPNLMVRPMLLNYIDDLINTKSRFSFSYELYRFLVNKWINREENRVIIGYEGSRGKFSDTLDKFSTDIAWKIFEKIKNSEEPSLTEEEFIEISEKYVNVQVSELELKSRSLLNRDYFGNIKFSHRSILEYFIATKIHFSFINNFDQEKNTNTIQAVLKKKSIAFIEEQISEESIDNKLKFERDIDSIWGMLITDLKISYKTFDEICSKLLQIINDLSHQKKKSSSNDYHNSVHHQTLNNFTHEIHNIYRNYCYRYFEKNGSLELHQFVEVFVTNYLHWIHSYFSTRGHDLEGLNVAKHFLSELREIELNHGGLMPLDESSDENVNPQEELYDEDAFEV